MKTLLMAISLVALSFAMPIKSHGGEVGDLPDANEVFTPEQYADQLRDPEAAKKFVQLISHASHRAFS